MGRPGWARGLPLTWTVSRSGRGYRWVAPDGTSGTGPRRQVEALVRRAVEHDRKVSHARVVTPVGAHGCTGDDARALHTRAHGVLSGDGTGWVSRLEPGMWLRVIGSERTLWVASVAVDRPPWKDSDVVEVTWDHRWARTPMAGR